MSSAETTETNINMVFHIDRLSCTANNKFTQLDGSLACNFSSESRTEQRPPRKRQKVLRSEPFRLESYQPNNLQSFEILSREQSVSYGSPTTQSTQGIQAEWPKRGRTNTRGRAPISTQYNSPLRSQSHLDCDTMGDRNPSIDTPLLQANQSQNRSVSPEKGQRVLADDGMQTPLLALHEFPTHIQDAYPQLVEDPPVCFIPLGLKSIIAETYEDDVSFHARSAGGKIDRSKSSTLYYGSSFKDGASESMKRGFYALLEIQKEADDCQRTYEDEIEWCSLVVRPLLNSALHKPRSSIWKVKSVQTKRINPLFARKAFLNKSEDKLAQKKIDFAIFLNPDSKETKTLYEALKQRVPKGSQGLWTHESTADLIPLFIFEIEIADREEGKFQLMTAARAFLKYLQCLLECSASESNMKPEKKASLLERLPPVFGWVVHQHEWKAYVSYSIGGDDWVWIELPYGHGSTNSKGQALRLLHIIETLKADFGPKYIAWLKDVLISE